MSGEVAFRVTLLARASESIARSLAADGALDAVLSALVERANRAWPRLQIDGAQLLAHIAERLPERIQCAADLDDLPIEDLCVVIGCLAGDAVAITLLDEHYLGTIAAALVPMRLGEDEIHEVRQQLRIRLLCGVGESPPKLREFSGAGSLVAWLRTCAVRLALNERRRHHRSTAATEARRLERLVDDHDDAERALFKRHYGRAFSEAFRRALTQLDATQRLLLSQHHLDGVTLEGLAAFHGLSRATVARRLAEARAAVFAATRCLLKERFAVDSTECDSIVRLARSGLDVASQLVALFRTSQDPVPSE
jgi:RNA polymerase sigma-70 factor (ECF subfamily)